MSRSARNAAWTLLATASALAIAACADDPTGVARTSPPQSLVVAPGEYTPGTSYFGDEGYIEYIAGNMPLIFTAPHGGTEEPAGIPERTDASCGLDVATVRDLNTDALVLDIQTAFFNRTGKYPHIVINRLHRNRLDANRPIGEAACGSPQAEEAWRDYHAFIEVAKARILAEHGKGWYTDVHGHGHDIQRLELGYELSATTLRRSDAVLDGTATYENASSFRTFSQASPLSFSELLRGPTALGTLFAAAGYPAVPSQQDPAPDVGESYFSGGYNTDRHACSNGGQICGVQIEANLTGVRNNATSRSNFAVALAAVYGEYLANFGITLPAPPPPPVGSALVVDNLNVHNDPARARFAASSSWVSGANTQSWATNFQLGQASASATNDGAEFLFYIAVPGTYTVDAWWPSASGRSPGASYRVFELDGGVRLADLKRDQRANGARWNTLGTFQFTQVGWAKVLMSRSLSEAGSLAADAIRVTVVNDAPVARLTLPGSAVEGSAVAFDGTASSDPDGDALTHAWHVSDGGMRTGAQATYTFADDGTYEVALTVRDPHGATHTIRGSIVVTNQAPQVSIDSGATLLPGERYASTGAFVDPGADAWTATVAYGDGSDRAPLSLSGKSFALSHRYASAGRFTVSVEVHDGDESGTATAQVIVWTPAQGVDALAADVRALVTGGALADALGRSMLAKLEAAAAQLTRGNAMTAAAQLQALVQQVASLRDEGRLAAADADALQRLASRIVQSIQAHQG